MSVSLKIDGRAFKRFTAKIPGGLREAQRIGLKQVGAKWQTHVTKERMRASAVGGAGVRTRTSKLRSGRFDEVLEDKESLALRVGIAGVPYAAIQEFGGTVRAKAGKWLTIPVGPALTPSGVIRKPARAYDDLVLLIPKGLNRSPMLGKWKASGSILSQEQVQDRLANKNVYQGISFNFSTGKSRASLFVPYFILKKSVKIKPRLGFYQTWKSWAPANAAKIMITAVRSKVAQMNKGKA